MHGRPGCCSRRRPPRRVAARAECPPWGPTGAAVPSRPIGMARPSQGGDRRTGDILAAHGISASTRRLGRAAASPGRRLRPSRSRRSSWISEGRSASSLARWNQPAKPGSWRCWAWNSRAMIMRSQSGIGTSRERPPFSRNLRKACAVWFFLLGGKSLARSMKQLLSPLISHGREHAVDLPLEAAALGRAVAQEDARFRAEAGVVAQGEVEGGKLRRKRRGA